jgi:hypothetical protein
MLCKINSVEDEEQFYVGMTLNSENRCRWARAQLLTGKRDKTKLPLSLIGFQIALPQWKTPKILTCALYLLLGADIVVYTRSASLYLAEKEADIQSTFRHCKPTFMNPELFLENGRETIGLLGLLVKVATINSEPLDRLSMIKNAGVDLPSLKLTSDSVNFAQQLVAEFKRFCVSEQRIDYHPMLRLIEYLRTMDEQFHLFNFDDQERGLFENLMNKGNENLKALIARRSIGRVEDAMEYGIGTGTLIKNNLILTCNHIISKSGVDRAWVRFGYKVRCDGITIAEGQKFELDLDNIVTASTKPDFAIIRIKHPVDLPVHRAVATPISSNESIRIIHHPDGKPIVISEWGKVMQVGQDYIDHNVPTSDGSSGAPILNRNWGFVAIHRGDPGVGRPIVLGTTEGLPLRTIWESIEKYV